MAALHPSPQNKFKNEADPTRLDLLQGTDEAGHSNKGCASDGVSRPVLQ